jgi:hypothetical protein
VKVGLLSQRQLSSLDDHISKQQQHLPPPLSATITRPDLNLSFRTKLCPSSFCLPVLVVSDAPGKFIQQARMPGCQDQVIASKRQTGRALVTHVIARLALDLPQSKVIVCVVVHLR